MSNNCFYLVGDAVEDSRRWIASVDCFIVWGGVRAREYEGVCGICKDKQIYEARRVK